MITLRPRQREDLALPRSWLDEPLVQRWWEKDPLLPAPRELGAVPWREAGSTRVAQGELEPDHPADSHDHVVYRLVL